MKTEKVGHIGLNTMKKYILFFLLIILLLSIETISAEDIEIISVTAGGKSTFIIDLEDGQKFWSTISINGGSENDIDFFVQNPKGITIIDLGRISQGDSFEFTAEENGSYVLNFENDFSTISSKVITLTFKTSLIPIAGIDPILLLAIIVVVIILLILVIVYERSRK